MLEPERKAQLEAIISDASSTAEERAEAYKELGIGDPCRSVPEQNLPIDEDAVLERYLTTFDKEWAQTLPELVQNLCGVFRQIRLGCINWEDGQLDILIGLYKRSKSAFVKAQVRNYIRALSIAASLPRWRNAQCKIRAEEFLEATNAP